jgi:hypothetical protein
MTVFSEPVHAGEHLVSEANGNRSRSVVTVTGGDYSAATVLGQETLGSAAAAAKAGGNTGDGTISAITVASAAKEGVYKVRFTSATKFGVEDPDGFNISKGSTGAAYADDVGFTITAGATPFAADDGFDITVSAGSQKYTQYDPTASNGVQKAAAILFAGAKASAADISATVHDRACEVNGLVLIWPDGVTDQEKATAIADLAKRDVIVRS